jgi:hypothetical protein
VLIYDDNACFDDVYDEGGDYGSLGVITAGCVDIEELNENNLKK